MKGVCKIGDGKGGQVGSDTMGKKSTGTGREVSKKMGCLALGKKDL